MIIPINTAKNNALKIEQILKRHSDKQQIDIILRDYIAYQGNAGYSGGFSGAIKELAVKACKNKRREISKVIQAGIFEILQDGNGILIETEEE